ncbi:MAG: Rieske 2Fe-2S domain-containing protein [Azospirillaceae bacterium]|nr:Rieske 2Fe-2S domain-containing protein [Azospirillaceae bacterium]
MPAGTVEVFVVCAATSIEPGSAKAFSLSRVDAEGQIRPFAIFIVRTLADGYFGYVNACPHQGSWLNFGAGTFFAADRRLLECGRHQAKFEIETGLCVAGPCKGENLEPVAIVVIDGELCLCGVTLVEDHGGPDPFSGVDDADETMEIMIHPD